MAELKAFYIIWYREMLKWARKRVEIISSIMQPIIWLIIFGIGMKSAISNMSGVDFLAYLAPGVISQTILFSAFFNGVSILMDREFGFLKEVLVSPVKRQTIITGKLFGGATIAFIQGSIALILAMLIGVQLNSVGSVILAFLVMYLISLAFMAMGLAIATKLKEIESFQKISRFTTMPMWFLSGGFYPVTNVEPWLKILVYLNPLTYGVDLLRTLLVGVSQIPILIDIGVLIGFTLLMLALGIRSFNRSEDMQ